MTWRGLRLGTLHKDMLSTWGYQRLGANVLETSYLHAFLRNSDFQCPRGRLAHTWLVGLKVVVLPIGNRGLALNLRCGGINGHS